MGITQGDDLVTLASLSNKINMIEFATSAMMLISIFYGNPLTSTASIDSLIAVKNNTVEDNSIVDEKALAAPIGGSAIVEDEVRKYFKDIPILAEIARCESGFRHIGRDGEIIRGEINRADIGVMQINTHYHKEIAEQLGLNLTTLRGNMEFGRKLYEKYGTSPWQSSAGCWEKYVKIAKK